MNCENVTQEASLCEVATDGTGFRVLLSPGDAAAPAGTSGLHHADYAAGGGWIVEIRVNGGDTLWYLPGPGMSPTPVGGLSDDNSPCVLPDGRVVSLWLERPGNVDGFHELKVMASDGSGLEMLRTGIDIFDVGLGCGGALPALFADGFESGDVTAWSACVGCSSAP